MAVERERLSAYIHVFFNIKFEWTKAEVRFHGLQWRLQTDGGIDF